MKKFLLKFLVKIPAATFLYLLLIIFSKLSFNFQWLAFAIAIDLFDWMISG